MSWQQEIDFSNRGYRRRLLQNFRCPDVEIIEGVRRPTKRVMKARDLKAVLREIEDFGILCTASHATIAENVNCDVTHLKRCIRALRDLGLIIEERRPRGKCYRIVFSEIEAAIQRAEMLDRQPSDRPTDRPTSGSITARVIDPLIDPNGTCDRPTDRPTSGSTNIQPLNIQPPPSEPTEGVAATAEVEDAWDEVKIALRDAGVDLPSAAIAEAKSCGIAPDALADAAYVVKHTEELSGGSIMFWIRKGGWPASGIRSASEIRCLRNERADQARASVRSDAESRHEQYSPAFIAAVCAKKLIANNLAEQVSDYERECFSSYFQSQHHRSPCDDHDNSQAAEARAQEAHANHHAHT